jgi:hypothetical protein
MKKKLVAVTIPIYKNIPDKDEQNSLAQCLRILGSYPIIFYCPEGMDITFYVQFCEGKATIKFESFKKEFFNGIPGYNKLMLSKNFYKRFSEYQFILIYQLDAWVFKDELEAWCKKGYDFIGAPYAFVDMDTYPIKVLTKYRALLKNMKKLIPFIYTFKQVGNGGLSLRNVKKTIWLLKFKWIGTKKWDVLMEDNYFQYWGNILFPFFKLPDEKIAAQFSIELDPKRTFEMIGKALPFGCHAYLRYEPEFWSKFISK